MIKNNFKALGLYLFPIALIFLFLLRMLWIGDVPFINDEPKFLDIGLSWSLNPSLLPLGLKGKMGVHYGPYTGWFYGLIFLLTKNIITFGYIKTFIVSLILLFSSLLITKKVEPFNKWFILPLFLSPYLFYYSRALWDLNISMTLLAVAFYLAFLKDEKAYQLLISFVAIIFSTLIHLMALPTALGLCIHFILFKRGWVKKNIFIFLGIVAVGSFFAGPYYWYVLNATRSPGGSILWDIRTLFFSFFAGRFLTIFDFSYFLGKKWQYFNGEKTFLNNVFLYLSFLTWPPYLVGFFGLAKSIRNLKKYFREKDFKFHVLFIGLLILGVHTLLSFYSGARTHPHYYNGAWVGMLLLTWYGLSLVAQTKYFVKIFTIYNIALGTYLLLFLFKVHHFHGSRELHYGPTLQNQLAIAKRLNDISAGSEINKETKHPVLPHVMVFLRKLDRLDRKIEMKERNRSLNLTYRYKVTNPNDGEIVLIEN